MWEWVRYYTGTGVGDAGGDSNGYPRVSDVDRARDPERDTPGSSRDRRPDRLTQGTSGPDAIEKGRQTQSQTLPVKGMIREAFRGLPHNINSKKYNHSDKAHS